MMRVNCKSSSSSNNSVSEDASISNFCAWYPSANIQSTTIPNNTLGDCKTTLKNRSNMVLPYSIAQYSTLLIIHQCFLILRCQLTEFAMI